MERCHSNAVLPAGRGAWTKARWRVAPANRAPRVCPTIEPERELSGIPATPRGRGALPPDFRSYRCMQTSRPSLLGSATGGHWATGLWEAVVVGRPVAEVVVVGAGRPQNAPGRWWGRPGAGEAGKGVAPVFPRRATARPCASAAGGGVRAPPRPTVGSEPRVPSRSSCSLCVLRRTKEPGPIRPWIGRRRVYAPRPVLRWVRLSNPSVRRFRRTRRARGSSMLRAVRDAPHTNTLSSPRLGGRASVIAPAGGQSLRVRLASIRATREGNLANRSC